MCGLSPTEQRRKERQPPLPHIYDTFDALTGWALFSTLDLKRKYWQEEMDPVYHEETAFTLRTGL